MTTVPLPDVPCVRIRTDYSDNAGSTAGNRFYLSYSGSAPSGANCATLASDVASAFSIHLASLIDGSYSLIEVDVLDIATDSGLSGQWTGSEAGTASGASLSANAATNVEFGIARRYRGGKPRFYLPPSTSPQLTSITHWSSTFIAAANTGVAAFFAALEALSIGSMGTLQHVNLSYFKGFENFTTPSGRERAVPTYRATALHDNITGYFAKAVVGSQRRRRTSTTP